MKAGDDRQAAIPQRCVEEQDRIMPTWLIHVMGLPRHYLL